jgi:2-hydroxy-3-keto-5-methylthiopentenyl-1-phosphate phosphatase
MPPSSAPNLVKTAADNSAEKMAVFCDFDGTFIIKDVGSTLAVKYVADLQPAQMGRVLRGEMTAWDYNMQVIDGMAVPEDELDAFLESLEMDPGAVDLVNWCQKSATPFRILSDGFDYNIDRLKKRFGVEFDCDSNAMHYEEGLWRIAPGYPNPDCGCGTGVCKRGRINAYKAANPDVLTVHIGNGRVSDLCGVLAADVGFAKDSLATELENRGVSFYFFETLKDVVTELKRIQRS